MSSFLKSASKQVSDVRNFLREAAGSNSIKYSAEKGARHIIYIPPMQKKTVDEETGAEAVVNVINAISVTTHSWRTADNKFKECACLEGVERKDEEGNILNDGTCPFCERVSDAWAIANYRKELEEENCKLTGDQRKKHLEEVGRQYRDERKQQAASLKMYMLVAKFRLNEQGKEILDSNGLPEYDLKVMKLSASRIEKIQQQVANSGSELPGSEMIFEYPSVDDRRLLVSQSTTTQVFPNNRLTVKYPGVVDKINEDVSKFDWDGIDKSFPELKGMTVTAARTIVTEQFEQWDKYQAELATNPNAKYLEYVVSTPTSTPNLNGVENNGGIPVMPTIPNIPTMETAGAGVAGAATAGIPTPTVQMPTLDAGAATQTADPNAVFAGAGIQA